MDATLAAPATAAALLPGWAGARVHDVHGAPVGHVADVLFDAQTRAPGWLLLALPREHHRFVLAPARGLRHRADGVQLAFDRTAIATAPPSAIPPDGLARIHATTLAQHYGVRCGPGPWLGTVQPAVTRGAGVPA